MKSMRMLVFFNSTTIKRFKFKEFSSIPNRWSLEGKNILVTGGTHGIGRTVVEQCIEKGANVMTCCRNAQDADTIFTHWKSLGHYVNVSVADVSTSEGRNTVFNDVANAFSGSLDCLVNNVGYNITKKAVDYTESDYAQIMATNVESIFGLSQQIHPLLKRAKSGSSIVNVGSVSGKCRDFALCH